VEANASVFLGKLSSYFKKITLFKVGKKEEKSEETTLN
jgi:hypothetical protein